MIDFEPTEEQKLIRDTVAEFAKTKIGESSREHERMRAVAEDIRKAAHELGIGIAHVPEGAGGQGLSLSTLVLLEEALGHADAGAAFGLPGPGALAFAALELGTREQQARILGSYAEADGWSKFGAVAFSEFRPNRERPGFSTIAKKTASGFEISGNKAFVHNAGLADKYLVFAQVDEALGWEGIGAFLVEASNPGLKMGERHETLGLDAAHFGEIILDAAPVSAADRLLGGGEFTRGALRFFSKQSLIVSARALGLARAAWELSRDYCEARRAFGKPIGHFQAIAFTLADRAMDVESARGLVLRAAWAWESEQPEPLSIAMTAQALAHTLEAAMRCADDSVQLHGGSGFIRDYLVEKLMRDAKQLALCVQTAEQADQVSAAIELGAPLDPALVLPTPETQAVFT